MMPFIFNIQTSIGELLQNSYGIALIAVLIVIGVAGIVYALSSLLALPTMKHWAINQVYEALIGIILFIALLGLYYLITSNPVPFFNALGVVSNSCEGAQTIFDLGACNLATFTKGAFTDFAALYYLSFFASLNPKITMTMTIPPSAYGVNISDEFTILPNTIPSMLSNFMGILLFMLLLNQIQMLFMSASWLFFGLFISIGFVGWIFGISRSFGGTMIALAIGLGLIYPLLISITYGFINLQSPSSLITFFNDENQIAQQFASLTFSNLPLSFTSFVADLLSIFAPIVAGLTFIPFLNFMILDAFILDFSQSMGEKISFLIMLNNVI
ncbi:MAG: hypothetical protein QXD11_00160 [Candidatus Micrarchaeaceae archaeon]